MQQLQRSAARLSGPGLWPGPRRQARRVGSGSARKGGSRRCFLRSGFCGAVGKDLRVPLRVGGRPGQCAALRPGDCDFPPRRLVHVVRDDRSGQLAEHRHLRRVTAGCGCGAVRGIGAAGSGSRRCAIALEEAGQAAPPPAARVPPHLAATARHSSARSHSPCWCLCSARSARAGQAWRAEGVPLKKP